MNGSAKPVPPPRDHLRIEKDGRLTSRLPAPQVPARTISTAPSVNNNVPREPPTKQELEAIRKFEVSFQLASLETWDKYLPNILEDFVNYIAKRYRT